MIKNKAWPDNWRNEFYCLNYTDDQIVKPGIQQWLSISLTPCNNVEKYGFEISEECKANKDQQRGYLSK